MQTFSSGRARVRADLSAVERVRKRLARRAARIAAERIAKRTAVVVAQARDQWGVDTGRGRASLGVDVDVDGTQLRVAARSTDPSVPFQRPSGSRRTFWQILIVGPLRRLARAIARDVAHDVAEDARRG